MKFNIIAMPGCPEDAAFLVSPLSAPERAELARRIEAGEEGPAVFGELLVRGKKVAKIEFERDTQDTKGTK